MIPNPYLIGGVALVISLLAGATGTLYYKAKEADTRADIAQAETDRLANEINAMSRTLSRTNQTLTQRDSALRTLRQEFENATTIVRTTTDATACADTALPNAIASVFAVPRASGNGDD